MSNPPSSNQPGKTVAKLQQQFEYAVGSIPPPSMLQRYNEIVGKKVNMLLQDSIPLKAHWITTGLKMGQVALSFGIDDLGGTNLNEKIVHDAGSETPVDLSAGELERLIRDAGYEPCLVDSSYEYVERG